ncbi:MAG: 30S ribosomal protein S9 [Candidatus Yanofskybacteria bacterium RIFCSPHIGHO2_01_FULL_44_22]|uniref:Small ribosomal subunit protein uS9 n=1 Tax=Candidatus Yanofskybacteria bacterium RIFCSPHIGHO2_01_FULL_44_22 TaxID=1802669 RepID=A0A1F8EYU2_9BACT|nr:MAG: 30S ribosomal protein S9 [Candidatus Yanofskybacteria bacterium RIFCSPHIGHO2_01_FULL_44_22]
MQEFPKNNNGKEKYYQAIGRRKNSIARVRLYTKKSTDIIEEESALLFVNGKDYIDYFSDVNLRSVVESPLRKLKSLNRFKAVILVRGGGLSGQAEAIKHGLSRALVQFDQNFKKKLKKGGFLTRDPRAKERRKYGLKKARKAPQWQKR